MKKKLMIALIVVAFISIFNHEHPPLSVDVCVWTAGIIFMFLIHAHGG